MFDRLRAKQVPALCAGRTNPLNLRGSAQTVLAEWRTICQFLYLISTVQTETAVCQVGYFRDDTVRINPDYG
jgi:nicotinate-nucleotide pyrophosphorylase